MNLLIFRENMRNNNKRGVQFINENTGVISEATIKLHLKNFFMTEEKLLGLVTIMCPIIAIVLFSFLIYHINLALNNTTTNESHKKEDV